MDIKILSLSDFSEILDNAIETSYSDGDWSKVFPKVSGYVYFIPQYHHDMEEYPDSFRGNDHAIAHATVQYPELYPKIEKLTEMIFMRNMTIEPFLSNIYEFAGTHYIVELILKEKRYMSLYVDFLLSNQYEQFQRFDFIRIVRRWGWLYETYYLLFARFFSRTDSFDDDMDYLNYSVSSLMDGHFENEKERNIFFHAIQNFLNRMGFDPSDNDYNERLTTDFEKMVLKHISPRNKAFAESMKIRYLNILNDPNKEEIIIDEFPETITHEYIQPTEEELLPEI